MKTNSIIVEMKRLSKNDFRYFAEMLIYSDFGISSDRDSDGYYSLTAEKVKELENENNNKN